MWFFIDFVYLRIIAAHSETMSLEFCWQKHDECDHMKPNQTLYQLTNDTPIQIWHCNCDTEFYNCLHSINTILSNRIGELYFNSQTRCYRNEYKIFDCQEYDTRNSSAKERRCVKYLLLLMTPIENQWFDLPFFNGKQMDTPVFMIEEWK